MSLLRNLQLLSGKAAQCHHSIPALCSKLHSMEIVLCAAFQPALLRSAAKEGVFKIPSILI